MHGHANYWVEASSESVNFVQNLIPRKGVGPQKGSSLWEHFENIYFFSFPKSIGLTVVKLSLGGVNSIVF